MRLVRILAFVFVVVLAACGSSGSKTNTTATTAASSATTTAAASGVAVNAGQTSLGTVLVNGEGRTLYHFTKDSATAIACVDKCTVTWPPVTVAAAPWLAPAATLRIPVVEAGVENPSVPSEIPAAAFTWLDVPRRNVPPSTGRTGRSRPPSTTSRSTCTRVTPRRATPTVRGSAASGSPSWPTAPASPAVPVPRRRQPRPRRRRRPAPAAVTDGYCCWVCVA